jgi:hypothetical protein
MDVDKMRRFAEWLFAEERPPAVRENNDALDADEDPDARRAA